MELKDLADMLTDRLARLEDKVDLVCQHCAKIDVTLAGQTRDTAHQDQRVKDVESALVPLRDQWAKTKGAGWLIGLLVGALELWHNLRH